ncbi:MAG: recombinase family protein [Lachnospiraceae bacterium]|nr:recombinase family protein [Lachnospiraceae bacterium]
MARTVSFHTLNDPIVALYVRVSTGYQVDKDSLPHQKKELMAYCKHILHIPENRIEIFEDAGKSAKNTKRPAYERMMQKVRSGEISHVLVYKIDRVSRNLVDFSLMYDDFKSNRVTFISLNEQFDTSSAIGEAILKIILVFAELERKMTSERVTDIMLGRAKDGLWNGANVPFGYQWDSVIEFPVVDEKEGPIVKMMYDMYERIKSSTKIRDYLNHNDIPTKRGGEWTSKTVADIIRNPIYKGTYRYNYRESARGRIKPQDEWIVLDDVFTPIVTKEQWEYCNKTMDSNAIARNNMGSQSKKKYDHVFGGLLHCGVCGSNMICDKDRARSNGFAPSIYRCGNRWRKNTCRPKSISDVTLGPFVFNYIKNVIQATKQTAAIQNIETLESILLAGAEFNNVIGIDRAGLTATFEALKNSVSTATYKPIPLDTSAPVISKEDILTAELDKNNKALERLRKLYLFDENAMSEKEYLETKQSLEVRNAQINNELAELRQDEADPGTAIGFINSASSFLVAHKLNQAEHIKYSEFAPLVDDAVLKDFVASVIDHIIILDGMVDTIVFKNGLTHKFIRKEK